MAPNLPNIRYIGYPCLDGFDSSHPEYFTSIREASDWLAEHGDPYFIGIDEQRDSMLLYRVIDPSMLADAMELNGVGVPFDYPDAGIEFGPRGGIRRIHV